MLAKSQRLVIALSIWIFTVLALLIIFRSLSFEFFFILCLIGFLIIIELSGPFLVKPKWRSRVNIIVVLGVIVFAVIVFARVMEIIGRYI
jgi:hypothetical protein